MSSAVSFICCILFLTPNISLMSDMNGKKNPRLELYQNLMRNTTRHVRLSLQPTTIILDPAIYSVIDVNEARESLVLNQWLEMRWIDPALAWNPADFGDIQSIRILQTDCWNPDITIYQQLEITRPAEKDSSFVTVSHDGTVLLSRTEQVTIHCTFEVGDFPYDTQNCTLTYVTWAYPSDEIIMLPAEEPEARSKFFQPGTEWALVSYRCDRQLVDYGHASWYEISYYIALERKPLYYIITLTVPSFFITNLALIGLFSPTSAQQDRGERVSIGLTALLTMAVVLMMVSDLMPKNATSFPKLGSYILWEMMILTLCTIMAVLIMFMHSRAKFRRRIPMFLRRFLMPHRVHDIFLEQYVYSDEMHHKMDRNITHDDVGEKLANHNDLSMTAASHCQVIHNTPESVSYNLQCRMYLTLRQIHAKMHEVRDYARGKAVEEAKEQHIHDEWTLITYRIDICFLVVSLFVNSFATYVFYIY